MNQLQPVFEELGISQYLDAFLDQGFDTWDTILDITESDLDALGVKLGHRRKLQRRIANYRGVTSVVSLVSPTRTSIEDISASHKPFQSTETKNVTVVLKRKYRRHPKPDDKAPERPPSAYVLFSNKMREDLKDQNLSFTEIAKLVGENWQNLTREEKAPYETEAQDAKDRYTRDMVIYKKTEDYQRYNDYLQEFRKKQAAQDTEASKRVKKQASAANGANSVHGSSSESHAGSEPPSSRHLRLGSTTSQPESFNTPLSQRTGKDNSRSPIFQYADSAFPGTPRGPTTTDSTDSSTPRLHAHSGLHDIYRNSADVHRSSADGSQHGFPWLSSSSDIRSNTTSTISRSPDDGMQGVVTSGPPTTSASSRTSSGSTNQWSNPPSLRTEKSSTGSISSMSSFPGPRTPSEGPLPIHALLSSKSDMQYALPQVLPSPAGDSPVPSLPSIPIHQHPGRPPGDSSMGGRPPPYISNGYGVYMSSPSAQPTPLAPYQSGPSNQLPPLLHSDHQSLSAIALPAQNSAPPSQPQASSGYPGLDGMNALLRASDIVGRPD